MHPIHHKIPHKNLWQYFVLTFNILGFLFPIYFVYFWVTRLSGSNRPIMPSDWLTIVVFAVVIGLIVILSVNFYVYEVVSDDQGLHYSFLWKRLDVHYDEIIDIRPMFNISTFHRYGWVVRTCSLTTFHRLYGLLYSFSTAPSMIVTETLSDFDELKRRIKA